MQRLARAADGELIEPSRAGEGPEPALVLGLSDTATFRCSLCGRQLERTIRQVKDGRLCLCRTKKSRIHRAEVEEALLKSHTALVSPEVVNGGKTEVTLRCEACQTQWPTTASNVMNYGASCPKCRKNGPITLEKAQQVADQLGFDVLTAEVHSGKQPLNWRCRTCGEVLEMPYRRMRNLRRCPACQGDEVRARLIGRMSRNPARD